MKEGSQNMEEVFISENRRFGLEMQQPWAELLLKGEKRIETRTYPLPHALRYRHIVIIESESGVTTSALANSITLKEGGFPRCIGTVVFSECFEYENEQQWDADRDQHCVAAGSAFDWIPDTVKQPEEGEEEKEQEEQKEEEARAEEAVAGDVNGDTGDVLLLGNGNGSGAQKSSGLLLSRTQQQQLSLVVKEEGDSMETTTDDALVLLENTTANVTAATNVARLSTVLSGQHWLTKGDSRVKLRARQQQKEANERSVLRKKAEQQALAVAAKQKRAEEQEQLLVRQQHEALLDPDSPPRSHEPEPEPSSRVRVGPPLYGWRVMGAFRGSVPVEEIPCLLRVYRSFFDCGVTGPSGIIGSSIDA
jgi:hypothetical protein